MVWPFCVYKTSYTRTHKRGMSPQFSVPEQTPGATFRDHLPGAILPSHVWGVLMRQRSAPPSQGPPLLTVTPGCPEPLHCSQHTFVEHVLSAGPRLGGPRLVEEAVPTERVLRQSRREISGACPRTGEVGLKSSPKPSIPGQWQTFPRAALAQRLHFVGHLILLHEQHRSGHLCIKQT